MSLQVVVVDEDTIGIAFGDAKIALPALVAWEFSLGIQMACLQLAKKSQADQRIIVASGNVPRTEGPTN